jgi:fumarylacetoacetate (FAA) hydrolase
MKFVTYSASGTPAQPGLLTEDGILPLPFDSMLELIHAGEKGLDAVRNTPRENLLPLNEVRLHAPIPRPPTLRDFYAFEQHVITANQNRGRDVPENWYKFPVFYFTNPNSIFGPGEEVPYPSYTEALDYELEVAAIIGKAGVNISPEDAPKHIFGYTIFNDWSARDVQREEMKVALGPAKGKDFASSLGPVIATTEEFADETADKPGVYEAAMMARVNGEERSRGNFKDIYWSFGQIIARAAESVMLYPGEVIGSGTVGTGCLLELTKGEGPWLQPGDVVELEIEGIGILRNVIAQT